MALTDEQQATLDAVHAYLREHGGSIAAACRALGHDAKRVWDWRRRARRLGGIKPKPTAGQPPRITDEEAKARAIKAATLNLKWKQCAHYAFISPTTLARWLADESSEFTIAFRAAQASALVDALGRVKEGGKDWVTGAWLAERGPGRFTVKGAEDGDDEVKTADPTSNLDHLEALLAARNLLGDGEEKP